MTPCDLSVIIPCYNEAEGVATMHERLAEVLPSLRQRGQVELILVDDGSVDGTGDLLRQAFGTWPEVVVVPHERNLGLGAALRTGLAHAHGDIIVTTDSDGTYPFSHIPTLLDYLNPEVDVVTASPYHPGGGIANVPAYRIFISKGASLLYRMLLDWRVHTYTALFRAYRRDVIETIKPRINHDGFLMVTQMLVEALMAGYRVAEYPTVLQVRQTGTSKARLVRITKTHLRYMASLIGRKLRGEQRSAKAKRNHHATSQ
ncbi:glycosyltransferase family 2 protein [Candidatus Viridilinea mediisalina]|uniref:Glycosyl transferase n=1 Tax=Candidatus Viridilinea mediisalina TaxID=2024553 RepID=A0A2A6RPC7_9CHLR|nr:glycosyltransferase family 2 protein [Candidatus Viridilinea mediisalina]PDW04766.1 glycosyl transferase [Candidatus Viridilinea mediisalina]